MSNHLWQPTKDTAFALRDISILHGGPESAVLPEHTHLEAQMSVHFRPDITNKSKMVAAHANLYASKQPHSGGWKQGWQVIVFQLSPQMLAEAAEEFCVGGTFEIRPFTAHRERLFEEMARLMLQEFGTPYNVSRFYAESVGHVVAGHILRMHSETRPRLKPPDGLSTKELLALRCFIDERIEAGFSVIDLANVVGLGPQRFAQKLRLATGLSPWRYVQAHRISRARNLLRNGRTPIAEISGILGFASQSHFTNVFRDTLGITPNAYRTMFR
ncbi:MAG TPA: AraC family transcriptional regulator [Terriglobales bacterium]|nr:AraC family transcriptional regulator [Terriglobales bacterium]